MDQNFFSDSKRLKIWIEILHVSLKSAKFSILNFGNLIAYLMYTDEQKKN